MRDHSAGKGRHNAFPVVGKLVSLNKDSNRGTFELANGKHIPYRYTGSDPDGFHMQFGPKGPVKVEGTVTFDENLEPTHIAVKTAHHLQRPLLFIGPDSEVPK